MASQPIKIIIAHESKRIIQQPVRGKSSPIVEKNQNATTIEIARKLGAFISLHGDRMPLPKITIVANGTPRKKKESANPGSLDLGSRVLTEDHRNR